MSYTIQYSTNDTDERKKGMAKESADYTELDKTANTLERGSPTYGPRPTSGPWPIQNWAKQVAGAPACTTQLV